MLKIEVRTWRGNYSCLAQEYKIDNESNILQPQGMCGSKLEANFQYGWTNFSDE